jgi:hypothetical protein
VDKAGNTTTETFIYDITAPVIEGITDLNKRFYSSSFEVSFKDLISGLKVIEVKFKQTSEELYRLEDVINDQYTFNKSGYYTLYLEDNTFNFTEVNFTLDMTPPFMISIPNQDISNSSITVTIGDNLSGIQIVVITKDLEPFYEGTNLVHTFNQHGKYAIYMEDKSNNSITKELIIDKVKPTISIFKEIPRINDVSELEAISLLDNQVVSGSIRFEFSDDHQVRDVKYFKDNQSTPITTLASFLAINLSGVYRFVVTDKAGNYEEFTIQIDNTTPNINVQMTLSGGFIITVSDEGSNEDVVTTINGREVANSIELKLPGTYEIISTDQFGNESKKSVEIELQQNKVFELTWLEFNGLKFNNYEDIYEYALTLYNFLEVTDKGSELQKKGISVVDFLSLGSNWDVNKEQTFYLITIDETKAYISFDNFKNDLNALLATPEYTIFESYFTSNDKFFNNTYFATTFNLNTYLGNQVKVINLNNNSIEYDEVIKRSVEIPSGNYEITVSDAFFSKKFNLVINNQNNNSTFTYIPEDNSISPTEIKDGDKKFFSYAIEIISSDVPLGAIIEIKYLKDFLEISTDIYDLNKGEKVELSRSGNYEARIIYYNFEKENYEELVFTFEILNEKPNTLVSADFNNLSYTIQLDTKWFSDVEVESFTIHKNGGNNKLEFDDFSKKIEFNITDYTFYDNQSITIQYRLKKVNNIISEEISLEQMIAVFSFNEVPPCNNEDCAINSGGATNSNFKFELKALVPKENKEILLSFDFEEGLRLNSVPNNEQFNESLVSLIGNISVPFSFLRVSSRSNNPYENTSKAIVISPRKGDNNNGESFVEFNLASSNLNINVIEFDAYFIEPSSEALFTKYELQVWNPVTNRWVVKKNILAELKGKTGVSTITVNKLEGDKFRFYAERGQFGNDDARVMLDNLKAYQTKEVFIDDIINVDNSDNSLKMIVTLKDRNDVIKVISGNTFSEMGTYTFELRRNNILLSSSTIEIDKIKKTFIINSKDYGELDKAQIDKTKDVTIRINDFDKIVKFYVNDDEISTSNFINGEYELVKKELTYEYELKIYDHAGNVTIFTVELVEIKEKKTLAEIATIVGAVFAIIAVIVSIIIHIKNKN